MKPCLQKNVTNSLAKIVLSGLFISQFLVSSVMAEEFQNVTDIQGCRVIKNEKQRLACYDAVSGGGIFNEKQYEQVKVEEFGSRTLPKQSEQAPAPVPAEKASPAATATMTTPASPSTEPATVTVQQAEPVAAPPTRQEDNSKQLSVTIVRSQKDGNGYHYFQTSDKQVWKQQNAGGWSAKVPFDAVIKKGAMGSFFLVNEGGKSTRVKRVK